MKICIKCKLEKDQFDFHKNKRTKDGFSNECKVCARKRKVLWIKEHPEQYKKSSYVYNKKYRAEHLDEIHAKSIIANKTPKGRFTKIKASARYRNKEFKLTYEQFLTFWDNKCYYCEEQIKGIGIDRVDNTKGYTMKNCVPCCLTCNKMKMSMTISDLVKRCKKIIKVYNQN